MEKIFGIEKSRWHQSKVAEFIHSFNCFIQQIGIKHLLCVSDTFLGAKDTVLNKIVLLLPQTLYSNEETDNKQAIRNMATKCWAKKNRVIECSDDCLRLSRWGRPVELTFKIKTG